MPDVGVAPLPGTFDITINRRRAVCAHVDPPSEAKCPRCATFKVRLWTFHPLERGGRCVNQRLCLDCGLTTLLQKAKEDGQR
jgi:hypothetical protein